VATYKIWKFVQAEEPLAGSLLESGDMTSPERLHMFCK
jgi:hypothetical protein